MATKRSATSDLNDTNWDNEEEPEEPGTFKKTTDEVLQKRVIKIAKRRNPISSNNDTTARSAFGTFSAFSKPATSSFAFLNTPMTKDDNSSVNGVNSSSMFTQRSNVSIFQTPGNTTPNSEKDDEYYAKLKGLNESVSNWIKKHVDSNPFINLRPVFKDYEKYFDELELLKNAKQAGDNTFNKSKDDSAVKKDLSSLVFKPTNTSKDETKKETTTSQFSFGVNTNTKEGCVTSSIPTFSFGSIPTTTTNAPSFSFGATAKTNPASDFSFGNTSTSTKPFAFTNVEQPATNKEDVTDEQEDDEPPKVKFTPVVEEGHTYTVKCKVFVKNQEGFGDRGVGTLYLKPTPNNKKIQLIVRANTNLGNLLCNFILSNSIPTKRIGKKDVMLVCLPTPDSKPPPVPILLRVKTPELADELLAELEKHKK
ncbi:hypothetical protein AMK59_5887 [Oryctes borbonicus]|uniref:RanBD1 domain-containing protein n=1 Tax=Oryctes borbonicus TaxID=1629725 RepID=A0A0T6B236_9SCAR|nr:hypothetical protein AMK59_5887 [Oryctes borbonicus]